MRKITISLVILLLVGALPAASDDSFAVRLSAAGLWPADADFREIYGETVLLPRLELSHDLSAGLSLWIAGARVKKNGAGPLSGIACDSTQWFFSAGPAYTAKFSPALSLRLAAGPMLVSYREEAGSSAVSGKALGADVNAALSWALSSRLALEGRLGWLWAADRSAGGDKFQLGGIWGGFGAALRF